MFSENVILMYNRGRFHPSMTIFKDYRGGGQFFMKSRVVEIHSTMDWIHKIVGHDKKLSPCTLFYESNFLNQNKKTLLRQHM